MCAGNAPRSGPTGLTEHHHQAQGLKLVHLGNGMEGWEEERREERKVGREERWKKPHHTTGRPVDRGGISFKNGRGISLKNVLMLNVYVCIYVYMYVVPQ